MTTEISSNIKNADFLQLWETKRKMIDSSSFYFSFSKLKQFRLSPQNFMQYLLARDKKTDSMSFGAIDHAFILEGEGVFNKSYTVLDRPTNGNNLKSFDGKIGKTELAEIEAAAKLEGKQIVKKSELEKATVIREMLMNDEVCRTLILSSQTEVDINYTLNHNDSDFPFRGRIDGIGDGFKYDLKNINNFQNKNLRSHILNEGLHIQAAIYQMSDKGNFNDAYYIIACNENGVLPILLKPSLIERGVRDLLKILDKFELCKLENRWFESNGFWFKNGVCEIE